MSKTKRKLTKEELTVKSDQIKAYTIGFDLLPLHVVITDVDGHILYANRAAEKNTGYTQSEMLGFNPGDLWGGNMPANFFVEMWNTIKVKKVCYLDKIDNKRKDGTSVWQRLYVCPVLNEKGDVLFFVGVEPDVTAEVANEMKLNSTNEQLKTLLDAAVIREQKISDLKESLGKFEGNVSV